MKTRVVNVPVEEVIGKFGVPGVNRADRRMVHFCIEADNCRKFLVKKK
jgi:hypothetical protein